MDKEIKTLHHEYFPAQCVDLMQRIVKLESRLCKISEDIASNTALTEELHGVLRGIQTMGHGVIWFGGVVGGIAVIGAAFIFVVRSAGA